MPPPAEPAAATRWPLVVVLILTQLFLAFSMDIYWVGSSRRAAELASAPFEDTLKRHVAIVDELAGAGADRAALETGLTLARSGSLLDRRNGAVAWVELLRTSAAEHPPEPRVQVVVQSRLDELSATLEPWDAAVSTWVHRSETFPGNVVSGFLRPPDKATGSGR